MRLALLSVVLFGLWPWTSDAATVQTYAVSFDLGQQIGDDGREIGTAQLTGHIVTNGKIGSLAGSDILGWRLTFTLGSLFTHTIDSAVPAAQMVSGGDFLVASATDLRMQTARHPVDYIQFRDGTGSVNLAYSIHGGSQFLGVVLPSASPVRFDSVMRTPPFDSVFATAVTPQPVPLPAGLPLLGAGLSLLGLVRLRQKPRKPSRPLAA